jgi:clan AA aspartic protease
LIEGAVYDREAVVDLTVHGPGGEAETLAFVVDTGFDGALTLHSAVVAALGLQRAATARAILADGSETVFDTYEAWVTWGDTQRMVIVDEADAAHLLGMGLLVGHELCIRAVPAGSVRISALPEQTA